MPKDHQLILKFYPKLCPLPYGNWEKMYYYYLTTKDLPT